MKIKKAKFDSVVEGKYFAKVKEFGTVQTKYGESLRWTFQTMNQDGSPGLIVSGLTGTSGTPKSKLTRYCFACGLNLTDDGIDTDALIGKEVVITVEATAGTEYTNVTNVEPVSMYRNVTPVSQPLQQNQSPAQQPIQPNGQSPQQTQINQ